MGIDGNNLVQQLLKTRSLLMGYIVSIVNDDKLAEDIFQEVSMIAYQKRDDIKNEQHLMGWLRITARNKSLKAIKKRSQQRMVFDTSLLDQLEEGWQKYDSLENYDNINALRHCLDRLSKHARAIVKLRYSDGISGQKLAELLNRKVNTIYVALSRIHKTLAECVTRQLIQAERSENE